MDTMTFPGQILTLKRSTTSFLTSKTSKAVKTLNYSILCICAILFLVHIVLAGCMILFPMTSQCKLEGLP